MTHYVLMLHTRLDNHPRYVMADAIDYYGEGESGSTWIYLRGSHALCVAESPEEINKILMKFPPDGTRSEQERWLNGE